VPDKPCTIAPGLRVELTRHKVIPDQSAVVDEPMKMLNDRADEYRATLDPEWLFLVPAAHSPAPSGFRVCLVTAAEQDPEPSRPSAVDSDRDDLEPAPTWVGDTVAAQRFGSPEEIRAALLPRQVEEFDAAFNAALTMAHQTLRLDHVAAAGTDDRAGSRGASADACHGRRSSADRPSTTRQCAVERGQGRTRSLTVALMAYTLDIDPFARA
jgi:hypothetical protein